MGKIKRETIKFLLPVDYETVVSNSTLGRKVVPLYINPNQIVIQDNKVIQETQTLGGYMIQFWGDKLTELQVGGTTGSGGIEAIEILRSVYRNEQIQFSKVLIDRQRQLAADIGTVYDDLAAASNLEDGLVALGDVFFDGLVSDTIESVNETIEYIKDPTSGILSESNPTRVLSPTLASFVVSVDMFFQGIIYRGFFRSFSVTESASQPGHFDYNFNFVVLRTTGKRSNFMPWHKNPRDQSGKPKQSDSIYSPNGSGMSFPYNSDDLYNIEKTATTILNDQSGATDPSQRSIYRFNSLGSKK